MILINFMVSLSLKQNIKPVVMYELANNYYVCKITKKAADQAFKHKI